MHSPALANMDIPQTAIQSGRKQPAAVFQLLLLIAFLAVSGSLFAAEEQSKFSRFISDSVINTRISADIGLATEFVRDGISQSAGEAVWQTGLSVENSSGLYAGIWGSNVNTNDNSVYAEWDLYAGYYQPVTDGIAVDAGVMRYTFFGDRDRRGDAHNDVFAKLLILDRFTIGYRHSDNWFGNSVSRQVVEFAHVWQRDTFGIEAYVAQHQLSDTTDDANYGGSREGYWHFRAAVSRTFNQWDYRIAIDRTNLGGDFDAGTTMQFSLHRYFGLK